MAYRAYITGAGGIIQYDSRIIWRGRGMVDSTVARSLPAGRQGCGIERVLMPQASAWGAAASPPPARSYVSRPARPRALAHLGKGVGPACSTPRLSVPPSPPRSASASWRGVGPTPTRGRPEGRPYYDCGCLFASTMRRKRCLPTRKTKPG